MSIFSMHSDEKQLILYVTLGEKINLLNVSTTSIGDGNETGCSSQGVNINVDPLERTQMDNRFRSSTGVESNYEKELYKEDSEAILSDGSLHTKYSSESNNDDVESHGEIYEFDKDNPIMKVGMKYPNKKTLKRSLDHFAVLNGFEFNVEKSDKRRMTVKCANERCGWRLHASVLQDKTTFEVKTLKNEHECPSVNRCGNKMASQFWVCDRVVDWLKTEGEISVPDLQKRLLRTYNVDVPYLRCFRGKELACEEIHGNWEESYERMVDFKEEIIRRNPGSIVDIKTQNCTDGRICFQRIFVAFEACLKGFLDGCRPYLALDGCHLKGKYKGVLAAATAIDGNKWLFPVAYAVIESENIDSWEWFLRNLQLGIGNPEGLVISSDRQKGLDEAVFRVYPLVEHRECVRHLYTNFKRKFPGRILKQTLYSAALAYTPSQYEANMSKLMEANPAAIEFLRQNHNMIWSRSQFGTQAKCNYITNNLSESFNSWISEARYKPVLELLDSIRQKIMTKMDSRRREARKWKLSLVPAALHHIDAKSKGLGNYTICRSSNTKAEVISPDSRCEVILDERKCTCRSWQVTGLPCIHACAFITSLRGYEWLSYVDPLFTVSKFRAAYAHEVVPLPDKNQWIKTNLDYKLLPPIMRRPAGRPRKKRIRAADEPTKKRHKCKRCNQFGHHAKSCKNSMPSTAEPSSQADGGSHATFNSTNYNSSTQSSYHDPRKRGRKRATYTQPLAGTSSIEGLTSPEVQMTNLASSSEAIPVEGATTTGETTTTDWDAVLFFSS
ncbi:uncharacterized protein LOC109723913 isoform X2 [Ananas comosus]|uniref:Uncharacterized protein LOC109723913 isoform X2 n=1 Tax=Ananas comosus TaxID=4615 RepID=A0A6P5GH85_ANACO|nr:uncharacterized protein LOC109723913 isoform X2 [Ananas comosus]